jgi:hypothetical protein
VKVKTKMGEISTPELEDIGPRTKYWASAMQDLVKVDEIYCVMGAALEEAYKAGGAMAMAHLMRGFNEAEEIVDVAYEVVPEGAEGSQHPEPAPGSQGSGPSEHPVADGSVPGSSEESPRG